MSVTVCRECRARLDRDPVFCPECGATRPGRQAEETPRGYVAPAQAQPKRISGLGLLAFGTAVTIASVGWHSRDPEPTPAAAPAPRPLIVVQPPTQVIVEPATVSRTTRTTTVTTDGSTTTTHTTTVTAGGGSTFVGSSGGTVVVTSGGADLPAEPETPADRPRR